MFNSFEDQQININLSSYTYWVIDFYFYIRSNRDELILETFEYISCWTTQDSAERSKN